MPGEESVLPGDTVQHAGPGVQVETDAPGLALSFWSLCPTRAQALSGRRRTAFTYPCPARACSIALSGNWLLLLAADGSPEIPVLIALQHRPESIRWTAEGLVVQRAEGVGTVAVGTAFGLKALDADMLSRWRQAPGEIPVAHLQSFCELLTAYAWRCRELFSVQDEWVHIRDEFTFLPWDDDWQTHPRPQAPRPLQPYPWRAAHCLAASRPLATQPADEVGALSCGGGYICRLQAADARVLDEAALGVASKPGLPGDLAGTLTEQPSRRAR